MKIISMEDLEEITLKDTCKVSFNVLINEDNNQKQEIKTMNLNENVSKSLEDKIKINIEKDIEEFNTKENIISDFWDSNLQKNNLYILDTNLDGNFMPEILKKSIEGICDYPDLYSNKHFNDIKCIVTKFEDSNNTEKNIVCFKIVYPMNRVAYTNRLTFNNNELIEVNKKEFVYRDDIDFFIYNKKIYIKDIKKFINFCNLKKYHISKALKTLEKIKNKYDYIEFDNEKFSEKNMEKRFEKISFAKKVIEVNKTITENNFDNFFNNKLNTKDDYVSIFDKKFKIEKNKLIIKTYKEFGQLLQIFNDEILTSNITKNTYETKNKEKLNIQNNKK